MKLKLMLIYGYFVWKIGKHSEVVEANAESMFWQPGPVPCALSKTKVIQTIAFYLRKAL